MPALSLLMLQAAPAQSPAPATPKLEAVHPCPPRHDGGEIVVCGDRQAQEKYRLRPLPEKYTEPPVRAATKIGGATVSADLQQQMILGAPSNRIMATVKIPF